MPTLKQLACSVEWELSKTPLQEFQTTYSDGYVETYIAVPELPTPFSIHLQSNGYIAPGLSMFVYIDGVYQCNRNRQNLKMPDATTTKKQTEVNFRVRQKEQMTWNGLFHGKPWKFERLNIVSDPNVSANERAPHGGEFVGRIEVVILRCYPSVYSNPSFNSAETLVNRRPSSSSVSSSDSDDLPISLDGVGKPKPKPKARPGSKPQAVGLDGAWDDAMPSTSPTEGQKKSQENSWDSWGELPAVTEDTEGQKKSQENSWDNWGKVPLATDDPSNKSWGAGNEASSAKDEQKMGRIEMTGANTGVYHPPSEDSSNKAASKAGSVSGSQAGSVSGSKAGSKAGSVIGSKTGSLVGSKAGSRAGSIAGSRTGSQGSKSWANWNPLSSAKDELKKTSAETTHSNTAVYRFGGESSSAKAASKAGSPSGLQGNQFHKAPSATGQQTPRTVELRGGGTSSYTARSRHGSAAGSPVFNVGFYNGVGGGAGTPPPLNMGPPPPRDWKVEEAAKKTTTKPSHKPLEQPVVDAWGDLPAVDVTNEATSEVEPDPKDKVDNWNAGGSDMPGAWDTFNRQKNDNDRWGATSGKPQGNNRDSWGAANDDVQEDGTWPGAGKASDWDEPAGDDAGGSNANEKPTDQGDNWGEANDSNEAQPSDDSNGNDTSDAQQVNDWNAGNGAGEDGGNKQNGGWGNDNAGETKPADDKPAFVKGSKKGSKAGSVGQGAKAGSVGKAASVQSKGNSLSPKGPGNATVNKKPGGWSPSPKPKKGTPPQAVKPVIATAQTEPSLSISTVPKAKPYWATWENPNGDEEKIIREEPALPGQDPLYAIPEEVAVRNNMSHQVRPGRPTTYTHKVSRPKYMDTHENPYAVFVFQYRDKAIIEEMLQTTIDEPEIDEKQRLGSLPKAELIEELLKEKARSASGSSASEKAATFRSNPYGIPLSPNVSALKAKLSKLEGSKAATPDMVGAWVDSAHVNNNDNETGSANGKGNWSKKPKNKGNEAKGVGNWAGNGGNHWSSNTKKDANTADNAWENNNKEPADDKKEEEKKDDDNGIWGGFDQDAGASSWNNEDKEDEGNGDTNANGSGGESWGEIAAGGGGGGW